MLTQAQADRLVALLKEAIRIDAFIWEVNQRQDETFISAEDGKMHFVLTLKRNPFEIRMHARTRDRNIGLMRIDNAPYHKNPDGSEIRNQPHLHIYRESCGLDWAEAIDWYDLQNPILTIERFLKEFNARFPSGLSLAMV